MNKKPLLLIISSLLFLVLAWIVTLSDSKNETRQDQNNLKSELRQPPTGGDFTVNTLSGPISLLDFRGKVVVVYFGYTLCPDICPTTLGFLGAALKQLEDSELDNIRGIFISVDPDRDTLEHLDNYAKYFHNDLIGATERKEVIDDIIHRYGAAYRMVKTASSLGYLVDHSAGIYFIDKEGKLAKSLPHGTLPGEMVEILRKLIE